MQRGGVRVDAAVASATAGVFIATGGPSIWLTNRIAHNGYDIEAWPYLYPFALLGVIGLVGLSRLRFESDLLQKLAIGAAAMYGAWALLSVTWSVAPFYTAVRSLLAAGVVGFAVWFGAALSRTRQLRAVSSAMGVAVAASAALVHFRPLEGGGYWDGERNIFFRGIFANSNSLGPVCVVGVISFVASALLTRRLAAQVIWSVLTLISLWLLWRSGSDTAHAALAIVILLGLVGLLLWFAYFRGVPTRVLLVAPGVVASIGLVVVIAKFWQLSDLLTADPTFGGRREIWTRVLELIPERLWQGHGYWAYINGPPPVDPILLSNGTTHDSVLEVLLGLGMVGLVPFLATACLAVLQVIRHLRRKLDVISLWQAGLVLVVLLENVTESFVLFYSYIWVLLIAASVASPKDRTTAGQALAADLVTSSSS